MSDNPSTEQVAEAYPESMETTAEDISVKESSKLDEAKRVLTLQDRCDRCKAEALGYAEKGDVDLLFCGHHLAKYAAGLEEQGFTIARVKTAE